MNNTIPINLYRKSKQSERGTLSILFLLTLLIFISIQVFGINKPTVKWRFKTEGPIRSAATMDTDNIYFGSADGNVYAVNKNTGTTKWKYQTTGSIAGSLLLHNGMVIVSSRDNYVYAIRADNGSLLWKFQMNLTLGGYTEWEYFTAAPVISGDNALVASGDGNLYALDVTCGKLIWKFQAGARMRATPLVHEGKIYQPANDGYIYVLSEHNGALDWKFKTNGASLDVNAGFDRTCIFTKPSIVDNLLVFGSRDGNVYAIDIKTKTEKWKFTYGPTWAMSTFVHKGTVFVGWSTNKLISAIDLNTGMEKWQYTVGSVTYTTAAIHGSHVIFGSADGNLYGFEQATGKKVWQFRTGQEIFSSVLVDGGTLYVGCDNGYMYALEDNTRIHAFKAVYQPLPEGATSYPLIDPAITPYLKTKGFVVLDSAKLLTFITQRIKDKVPSVIVFAYDMIPMNIIGKYPATGLIRQYLESGGKILWFGSTPMRFEFDASGRFIRYLGVNTAEQMLRVTFNSPEESGNYYSRATQEGLNRGLSQWLKTTSAAVAPEGVIPLAVDEYNRVSAWLKKFDDQPGSGFISCRTWAWEVPMTNQDLELVNELALYGLPVY
jgi:outer membrane protein assembly factor BamB